MLKPLGLRLNGVSAGYAPVRLRLDPTCEPFLKAGELRLTALRACSAWRRLTFD